MKLALTFPLSENLKGFSDYLWRQKIPHRISEKSQQQVLWVAEDQSEVVVQQYYEAYQLHIAKHGVADSTPQSIPSVFPLLMFPAFKKTCATYPVVMLFLSISIIITLLIDFGVNDFISRWFSFTDRFVDDGYLHVANIRYTIESWQWWRLITPIFLHFSLMHLLFNMLWLWEMGRRIEIVQSSQQLLWIILMTALVSNTSQYLMLPTALFGGMSGVVYGLLAYTWLLDRIVPQIHFGLPPALMVVMMVFLLLGFTRFYELLGVGAIANTAHITGLLTGLLLAFMQYLLYMFHKK